MASKKPTKQGVEKQLQAAVRRYLRAVDHALPHLERLLSERKRIEELRDREGANDD